MSLKKFGKSDIIRNAMQAYPHSSFFIYSGSVYYNNKPHILSAILVLSQNLLAKMGKECSGPVNWLDKASIPSSKSTLHNDIPIVPTATFEDALQVLDLEQKDLGPIGKEYVETLRTLNLA